ncbi:MAG: nicotinate (nicotinamide) nucleotide adenylyltransferase [Crocinitomicaceae bacterium]
MSNTVKHIIDGFAGMESEFSKRVGLYFGSFNPIHIGHLIIANYLVQEDNIDEVWFVVTPENPHKKKKNLLEDYHRLAMVRIAVEDNVNLKASDIEFNLPKPSYTVYTLQALTEKHPNYQFTLIMGEDNLRSLHKWKNYEQIIERYSILIYPRVQTIQEAEKDTQIKEDNKLIELPNVRMTEAPVMKISSSFIRNMIKDGKDVRYLLSESVFSYLDEMNFYQ